MRSKLLNLIKKIYGTLPMSITTFLIIIFSIGGFLLLPKDLSVLPNHIWWKIRLFFLLFGLSTFPLVYWAREEYPLIFTTIKGEIPKKIGVYFTFILWVIIVFGLSIIN